MFGLVLQEIVTYEKMSESILQFKEVDLSILWLVSEEKKRNNFFSDLRGPSGLFSAFFAHLAEYQLNVF